MTDVGTPSFNSPQPVTPSSHWGNYDTKGHSVQFYQEDSFLLENLSRMVGAAIASGDAALVIATAPHRQGLMQRLRGSGFDVNIPVQQGRFLSLDAADTLARFMVDGHPDSARFEQVIGAVVEQVASALPGNKQIVAFGEMVALLCAEGNTDAAIHLEQLWNQLAGKYSFHLHCAYSLSLFPHAHNAAQMEEICRLHSHVVPAEPYTSLENEEERHREIAVLQQKAQALETEIAKREMTQAALEKREAELTDFLENAVVSMHWVAADGTILWANKAELALLGYQPHEYIGHHIAEFHADNEVIDDILERLQRNEELHGRRARLRCKNGEMRDVRIHSNVCWKQGEFVHTRCFTLDITDALRSERRIAAQHAIARLLSEVASLSDMAESILKIICSGSECDLGAVWLVENNKLRSATIWHSSAKEFPNLEKATSSTAFVKGEGLPGRIWATNQPAWIEDVGVDNNLPRLSAALQDGVRSALGFPISTGGGPVGVIEFFSTRPRKTDEEFMKMMAAVGNQIGQFVERKKAEQALRESEQRFRVITEASPIMVWMSGPDKLCYYFNKGWLEFVGRTLEQEQGNGWAENVHPEDFDRCLQIYVSSFDARRPFEMEYRLRNHSGQYRWILDHGVPRFTPEGKFEGYIGGCLDIHEQKEAAERLNTALGAAHRLAAIVESSDDAIASKDLNGIVTSWNKSAERLFGYTAEEMIGKPITLIIPPELHSDEEMILAKIRRGEKIDHFETVRVNKNGEPIDVSLTISPMKDEHGSIIGAAKIVRDITQNKKIERALRTTEKLAAAGRLAATVAHEINNPLEAVTNLVYLAKRDLSDSAHLKNYLELAGRELDRVAHIARQTLGFYRDTSSPSRVNVTQTLDDLLFLYEKRFESRNIKVVRQYNGNIEITALAGEIRQAFSNIITNAIDAMPEGGSLLVRASLSREWKNSRIAGVRVTFADTGSGIASCHRKSLFQPFFTTKEDVGTGLGLWITRGIVEKHQGVIHLKSKTGPDVHGTAFSIFLPAGRDDGQPMGQEQKAPRHESKSGVAIQ